ncbi:hypothetical protein [Blautia obeum]|uniref:Uncharacterized protein n=1 Tax=Blautia obeum TaxID=40520 RepID=A0A415HVP5_9FIRM|nr:hypothetical protein [Blautia obeum]RHK98314.1 hypothetical protein DW040_03120 [Blautia obeum]
MKEIGRKRINYDSIVTVELSLRELQIIKDACGVSKFETMRNIWDTKNPPYTFEDKDKVRATASAILSSYM